MDGKQDAFVGANAKRSVATVLMRACAARALGEHTSMTSMRSTPWVYLDQPTLLVYCVTYCSSFLSYQYLGLGPVRSPLGTSFW